MQADIPVRGHLSLLHRFGRSTRYVHETVSGQCSKKGASCVVRGDSRLCLRSDTRASDVCSMSE